MTIQTMVDYANIPAIWAKLPIDRQAASQPHSCRLVNLAAGIYPLPGASP